jgi:hypothetical protein
MLEGGAALPVFIDTEKIFSLAPGKLDLYLVVDAEVEAKPVVQLPAELIAFYRSDEAQETRFLEELARHILYVQL